MFTLVILYTLHRYISCLLMFTLVILCTLYTPCISCLPMFTLVILYTLYTPLLGLPWRFLTPIFVRVKTKFSRPATHTLGNKKGSLLKSIIWRPLPTLLIIVVLRTSVFGYNFTNYIYILSIAWLKTGSWFKRDFPEEMSHQSYDLPQPIKSLH